MIDTITPPAFQAATLDNLSGGRVGISFASGWHPNDFVLKSKYGVGVDWPLAYTDIEPWYVEAENAIGVAGNEGHRVAASMQRLDQCQAESGGSAGDGDAERRARAERKKDLGRQGGRRGHRAHVTLILGSRMP